MFVHNTNMYMYIYKYTFGVGVQQCAVRRCLRSFINAVVGPQCPHLRE